MGHENFESNREVRQPKNYYEILGVLPDATDDEIKLAYRTRVKETHPDIPENKGREDEFREISGAYEVLSDPNKRKNYNLKLEKAKPEKKFDDFFQDYFKAVEKAQKAKEELRKAEESLRETERKHKEKMEAIQREIHERVRGGSGYVNTQKTIDEAQARIDKMKEDLIRKLNHSSENVRVNKTLNDASERIRKMQEEIERKFKRRF